eukprot:gene1731-500_t
MKVFSFLIFVLIFTACVNATVQKKKTTIVELTPDNFSEIVMNKKNNVLVEFYATWCGYCKQLAPKYVELSTLVQSMENIIIARIDGDKYKSMGEKYNIYGYPTLKWFGKSNKNSPLAFERGTAEEMFEELKQKVSVVGNKKAKTMPSIFLSHGSPNTIIKQTKAFKFWRDDVKKYIPEKPKGIICISAHWMTNREVRITASPKPKTIHDFGGFEQELYRMTYDSPGDPVLARKVQYMLKKNGIPASLDPRRGYDHGSWTLMKSIFPKADIPMIQISLINKDDETNFKIGEAIKNLKKEGILIIGSGGVIHNLGLTFQYFHHQDPQPVKWAIEFQDRIKSIVQKPYHEMKNEIMIYEKFLHSKLAIPTNEHFLPLIVTMGSTVDESSRGKVLFLDIEYGLLSMEAFLFG